MWLRDSLPSDLRTVRVLSFGFNSDLVDSVNSQGVVQIADQFVAELGAVRQNSLASFSMPVQCMSAHCFLSNRRNCPGR